MADIPLNRHRAAKPHIGAGPMWAGIATVLAVVAGAAALHVVGRSAGMPLPAFLLLTGGVALPSALAGAFALAFMRRRSELLARTAECHVRERLVALQKIGNELSMAPDLSTLCRRAVELGRSELGFDRLGVWFNDETGEWMRGSWGVDEHGQLRDERDAAFRINENRLSQELRDKGSRFHFVSNAEIVNHRNEVVSRADWAQAGMWNGDTFIGFVSTDNMLTRAPFTEDMLELLVLFAHMLGHLCTLKRAEESLREDEERFRAIAEQIPESLLVIEPNGESPPGRIIYANASAARLHGFSDGEMIGLPVRDLDVGETVSAAASRYENIRHAKTIRFSGLRRRKNGETFPVDVSARLIHFRGREAILSLARDETERLDAERALRESESRFRSVLTAIPDVVFILDAEGRYRAIYTSEESLLVKPASEMLGRTLAEVHPEAPLESFHQVIGSTIRHESAHAFEYPLRLDGERRWFSARVVPFGAPEDPCVLWVGRDVTERKKAELALRESEKRFRGYFEQSLVGMNISDPEGRYLEVNDEMCRLLGRPREDIIGRVWLDFVHPDDLAESRKKFEQALKGKVDGFTMDRRYLRPDGTACPAAISTRVVRKENGKADFLLTITLDMTERASAEAERRWMEAQIQHTQKLESLGVLAGGIAHDFNNLLVAILGNADLALSEMRPESTARPLVENVEKAARRAAELTNQMLAYSGKGRFVIEPLDLNAIVGEMTHLLEVSISKKAVMKYNYADNLGKIEADAAQIRQVIMNLVINASDAIGDRSGVITVSTGMMFVDANYIHSAYVKDPVDEGYYACIEVSDTGHGMDHETQSRIFDPFFTTKSTGRGLGLAAVLGIVRGHRGLIKVYSEPGRGTTFKALFPCTEDKGEKMPPPEASHSVTPPEAEGQLILVADDEESVRAVAKRILERAGFKVILAADGREAVEIYTQSPESIGAVLLDMTMPHMDGAEAYREMRRIRPDVIVVLTSGYNEQEAVNRFAGKGLSGFIQKPYHPRDLARIMSEALTAR